MHCCWVASFTTCLEQILLGLDVLIRCHLLLNVFLNLKRLSCRFRDFEGKWLVFEEKLMVVVWGEFGIWGRRVCVWCLFVERWLVFDLIKLEFFICYVGPYCDDAFVKKCCFLLCKYNIRRVHLLITMLIRRRFEFFVIEPTKLDDNI